MPPAGGDAAAAASAPPLALAGCFDGTVALVSLSALKGRVVSSSDRHDQAVEALVLAPRAGTGGAPAGALPLVASCSCDCRVVLWNVPDLTVRCVLRAGEGFTRAVWLGTLLLAGCTDGDVRGWESRRAGLEAATGGAVAAAAAGTSAAHVHLLGHRRTVLDLDVARMATGGVLVTVADDGCARAFALPAL
jgi:WD40 repeat protein